MASLFMPLSAEFILLASKRILTDLTDLERGSRKQNVLAKVITQSVQVESGTPTSTLSI